MQPTFPPLPPAPPAGPPGEAPQPFGHSPGLGPGGPDGAVAPRPPRETKAAASLALGVLSVAGALCGVGLSLGLPAIVLGALAHRDIRRSGGVATRRRPRDRGHLPRLDGLRPLRRLDRGRRVRDARLGVSRRVDVPALARGPPGDCGDHFLRATGSRHGGASCTSPAGRSGRSSSPRRRPPIAPARRSWSRHRCGPATPASRSIAPCPIPGVQQALSDVRWLRVDVAEFRSELAGLRMNEPTVPWFYLLDSRGQPRDAISADEWDDNDAENIAPVLGAFVHGKLQPRRTSWRGRTSL